MLKHIDRALEDWVECNTRMLEASGIGHRPKSTVADMMETGGIHSGQPPGTRVPFLRNTPDQVKRIERVLRALPDNLLQLVREHYILRAAEKTKRHYRELDRLHWAIAGALLMVQ